MPENFKNAEYIANVCNENLKHGDVAGNPSVIAMSIQLAQVQATLAQVETLRSIDQHLADLVAATRQAATR